MSDVPDLPDEFVAVKFYFRPSFPETAANKRLVRDVVAALAERTSVVVLNTGLGVDDHAEVDPGADTPVTWLLDGVQPNHNLEVQSYAISRSKGFVGTYGGLAYLAPSYGVPSVAFYSDPSHFLPSHLDVARRSAALCGGSIVSVDARHLDVASLVAGVAPDATVAAS
jgi:hypothetical protein